MKELLKKFELFEPIHIVGDADEVIITTYSNKCPETNTDYLIDNSVYRVHNIIDVTTDEEFEEGLSFIEFKVIKQ
jgi:hypothetical protein